MLSPQQMDQLLYNRFINVNGIPGHNISADLEMEHLNREVKNGIVVLGSGKTEQAIIRLGKAIGTIAPILQQFDKINCVADHHSQHKAANMKKDLNIVIEHIKKCNIFITKIGRRYPSFPHPKCLIHKQQEKELLSWIKTHIQK